MALKLVDGCGKSYTPKTEEQKLLDELKAFFGVETREEVVERLRVLTSSSKSF